MKGKGQNRSMREREKRKRKKGIKGGNSQEAGLEGAEQSRGKMEKSKDKERISERK